MRHADALTHFRVQDLLRDEHVAALQADVASVEGTQKSEKQSSHNPKSPDTHHMCCLCSVRKWCCSELSDGNCGGGAAPAVEEEAKQRTHDKDKS